MKSNSSDSVFFIVLHRVAKAALFLLMGFLLSLWYIKMHQPKPKTNWLIHHERDTLIKKAVVTRHKWRVKYDTLIWTKHDTARFYDSSCCELLGHCAEEVDVLWSVTELDSAIISAKSDTIAMQSKQIEQSAKQRKKLRKGLLLTSIAALFGWIL